MVYLIKKSPEWPMAMLNSQRVEATTDFYLEPRMRMNKNTRKNQNVLELTLCM